MKTLILGGVRSGKTRTAAALARASGRPVTLIATAQALDAEMSARIAAHRASRPHDWTVIEEPVRLADTLERVATHRTAIIVDCLTLWLTNLILGADAGALERETRALLEFMTTLPHDSELVLVGNEVGLGIVPVSALARRFADEAGTLHQGLAERCDRVLLVVAGTPLVVRGAALPEGAP